MAQELTIPVTHLYSEVAGREPPAEQILVGQLAINGKDKKLFTKDTKGNIISVGGDTRWGGVAGDVEDQEDLFDTFVTIKEWNKVAEFIDGILNGTVTLNSAKPFPSNWNLEDIKAGTYLITPSNPANSLGLPNTDSDLANFFNVAYAGHQDKNPINTSAVNGVIPAGTYELPTGGNYDINWDIPLAGPGGYLVVTPIEPLSTNKSKPSLSCRYFALEYSGLKPFFITEGGVHELSEFGTFFFDTIPLVDSVCYTVKEYNFQIIDESLPDGPTNVFMTPLTKAPSFHGNVGKPATYSELTNFNDLSQLSAQHISNGSPDSIVINTTQTVFIDDGLEGTTWIKYLTIPTGTPLNLQFTSNWFWQGGDVPTLEGDEGVAILVLAWVGTSGLLNLLTGK